MSSYKVDRGAVASAYAKLYQEYTTLGELADQVRDHARQVDPAAASPHMDGVSLGIQLSQRGVETRLLAEIITVKTEIASILDAIHQAVSTFGAEDDAAAQRLTEAMSRAGDASAMFHSIVDSSVGSPSTGGGGPVVDY